MAAMSPDRQHFWRFFRRFFQAPAGSFFLFGPRGTGKSTWLRQRLADALWLDLLDPQLQRLYQARPELRFVLTGSSARKLRRDSWNLLAGRLVEATLHPFMAAELGGAFDLQRALAIGLVPLVVQPQRAPPRSGGPQGVPGGLSRE
jgi:uncharacterized protein